MSQGLGRSVGRCGICAFFGEDVADELYGCKVPADIDMDSASGMIVMDGIVKDKELCSKCKEVQNDPS